MEKKSKAWRTAWCDGPEHKSALVSLYLPGSQRTLGLDSSFRIFNELNLKSGRVSKTPNPLMISDNLRRSRLKCYLNQGSLSNLNNIISSRNRGRESESNYFNARYLVSIFLRLIAACALHFLSSPPRSFLLRPSPRCRNASAIRSRRTFNHRTLLPDV